MPNNKQLYEKDIKHYLSKLMDCLFKHNYEDMMYYIEILQKYTHFMGEIGWNEDLKINIEYIITAEMLKK